MEDFKVRFVLFLHSHGLALLHEYSVEVVVQQQLSTPVAHTILLTLATYIYMYACM